MGTAIRWSEEQLAAHRSKTAPVAAPAKPSKHGNVKTTVDGVEHASARQARRWQVLQLREIAGEISRLRREVPYALVVDGIHVCTYVADHVYQEGAREVVEDAKSPHLRTNPVYRIKKKLMQACHRVEIHEV